MMDSSRRILLFVVAFLGGVGLLILLMLLFTQPPQPIAPSARSAATPTPHIVATVDDEPVLLEEWQRAVALDHAMSSLIGQMPPDPEETLSRLINERLVLRAASTGGISEAEQAEAETWLANFLANWGIEEAVLEQTLARVGLTRADLEEDIVPRLLRVQWALETLPPDGDDRAWVAEMRDQAKVELLEDLTAFALSRLTTPELAAPSTASQPLVQPTPLTDPSTIGPRAGDLAPDFTLEAADGATVRLFDLRGQPVVLNFWATWCASCTEELLMLQAIQDEGLVILGIAVREAPNAVTDFASQLGLKVRLPVDQNGGISDAYQVRGLPTTLFVDREGVVVARHVGPLDQAALDSYLSTLHAP